MHVVHACLTCHCPVPYHYFPCGTIHVVSYTLILVFVVVIGIFIVARDSGYNDNYHT